tara:strand:+ start:306 stop:740 length:435 start_codon:yes stop_codon:yes gene_type:complete
MLSRKLLLASFFVIPALLIGCGTEEKGKKASMRAEEPVPASSEDIFLYRAIGTSYLCNALSADIEFPKAVGIAAATYVQLLKGKHGGLVESAGDNQLTNKQLFSGAEFQVVTGALQNCAKKVPDDVKEKVEKAIENQSEMMKEN